ncbi:MAG: amidohydrolase [Clostridia bacterium]|nr:amidohydrolase [Clostridia bacterium]
MNEQLQKITNAVEKYRALILSAERYLWAHPETGYKEYMTTDYMAEKFRTLGYTLTMAEGITGFYTVLDTGREGPEIMILGELDSIICPAHKEADSVTGAVHSCGHHAQCATLLGIAAALKEQGMLDGLSGRIRLCAVPAEELLELEYRGNLRREGKIRYFGGKSEFLSRGYFDGVDIAFLVHTTTGENYVLNEGHVGCMTKSITYRGKAAHAGGAPQDGINALYAANCGLNAVNAIRETFRDADQIRVHPIVTAGGDMVNAIPETVRLESYVRGATFDAITKANRRVNRALVGAALSLGANVDIVDVPGYAPNNNDPVFSDLAEDVFSKILPARKVIRKHVRGSGSTDMGDLSSIMPTIQPYAPGAVGTSHGNDYYLVDPVAACVDNAKWQLAILFSLLENGAEEARRILAAFKPQFESAEAFLAYMDSLYDEGDRITYTEEGATARL